MKRIIALFIVVYFFQVHFCFALPWKELHEKADKQTLAEALEFSQKKPDSIEGLYTLGLIYLNLHKDKDAKDVFNKIISLGPETIEARWGLAEVLRREHDISQSEKIVNEVIKSEPDFSPAYITLAYSKHIQMNFNEAVRLVSKVINQGQDKVDLSNYVRANLLMGGTKGMIAHYGGPISKLVNGTVVLGYLKKAQSLQPDSPVVAFGLGSFYLLAPTLAGGDLDKAETYLNKAINIDPLFCDAYVRLAQLYKLKGDEEKYKIYLNKALEIDPKSELAIDIKEGKCKFVCNR